MDLQVLAAFPQKPVQRLIVKGRLAVEEAQPLRLR
jgi:hypothetical protein